jgi:hypothetical protein
MTPRTGMLGYPPSGQSPSLRTAALSKCGTVTGIGSSVVECAQGLDQLAGSSRASQTFWRIADRGRASGRWATRRAKFMANERHRKSASEWQWHFELKTTR